MAPGIAADAATQEEADLAVQEIVPCFSEFGVSAATVEALAAHDIVGAFPIQVLVMPDALAGRDVLAKSRTGSGKTLAFAVPIVEVLQHDEQSPSALILVPTRELASQVADEFSGIAGDLRIATVYGGVGIPEQGKRAKRCDVIVATPGRLLDLVNRKMLRLDRVRIAVLDEADRMLDMGFLPDVSKIMGMLSEQRQTMLFSATLDGDVGRLAKQYTVDAVRHEIADARPVVSQATHRFLPVKAGERLDVLTAELKTERGRTLIFVRTKRGADRLAHSLGQRGFKAQALHGDMRQQARERALERFERGSHDVLVATDVAARGLHVDDITHVINYDPPEDDKAYVHRVGRTARAGRTGVGITLVLPDQRGDVSRLAARLKLGAEIKDAGMVVHPPRVVGSSRNRGRRNRMLGRRPRRRF